jgi:LytS/YehU family sensor histidine kinase
MVFLSLGLRVLERQSKIGKMQEEMEKAKLNAELALLKSQISPHFFFNTLNNIYSLIGKAPRIRRSCAEAFKAMRYLYMNQSRAA